MKTNSRFSRLSISVCFIHIFISRMTFKLYFVLPFPIDTTLTLSNCVMMTSSNGIIFRYTCPLCGEFTGHQWIPRTKASDAELWFFFDLRLNKRLSKQSWGWWFETPSRPLWRQSNVVKVTHRTKSGLCCVCKYFGQTWWVSTQRCPFPFMSESLIISHFQSFSKMKHHTKGKSFINGTKHHRGHQSESRL